MSSSVRVLTMLTLTLGTMNLSLALYGCDGDGDGDGDADMWTIVDVFFDAATFPTNPTPTGCMND